ncbi:MAG: hypothetical protein Q6361_01565 [Candidatus Hermodarchaeota archaeon]|nr:hypothetical protein [Candidatus Hermodarchaeota archaeon]
MLDLIVQFLVILTPSILGFAAFITGSWVLDAILRARDEKGLDVTDFFQAVVKFIQFLGMAMGVICLAALIALVSGFAPSSYADILTVILLAVIGFVLLIAPVAKLPWAALVAFIIAILIAVVIAFFTPAWIVTLIPFDFKWIVIGAFIVIGLFVFLSLKWIEDLIKAFAYILASKPVTLILAALGMIQAALIIFFPGGLLFFLPF